MTDNLHCTISSGNGLSQGITEADIWVTAELASRSARQQNSAAATQVLQILDSSDDCIKLLDLEGRILFMSRAGQALLGIQDIKPFLNTSWAEFWEGADQQAAVEALARARVGKVCTFQGYRPTMNGSPKWWDSKVSPIRGAEGQVEQLLCISRDITERRRSENERQQAQERLRESEEHLSAIFSQAAVGLSEISLDGQFQRVNDEMCRILGRSREEILTASVVGVTHLEDVTKGSEAFEQLIETGEPISLDKRYLRPDGTSVWANSRLTRLDDEQGCPRSVLAVTVDLRDRLQAEEALREREQRLSIATQAAQLGIFEWKVPEDITIWENARQYELFGLTPADGPVSAQEFFLNYLHPGDTEALTARLTEAMQTGILLQTSYRICRKDGTTRWLEVNGQFEFAADGSPLRFVGVNADITDRKQAEAIITTDLENTRLLRDLSARLITEDNIQVLYDEIVSAAITLTQADAGSIQALDESTQELVLLATQGIDRTVTDHFQRVTASSITSCGVVLATGKRAFVNFDVPESEDPDGSLRLHVNAGLICAQSTPMISRSGRRIGMVSTHWCKHHRPSERELRFLDLLVRQAADLIEQRQTAAEREQLLAREQAAREEADLANRMKDEFLAVLSHELRSPLNPILGWSRLLQKNKLDEAKIAQALAIIERNAKLQAELIEDLLDVSRILRGKLSLNVSPVNLASMIKAAIETVRLAAEAKSITVEVNLAPNVKPVSGDSTRLQQVVWNLLSNAVKFTPTGGRVTVRLEQVDTQAKITVSDNGKGIPSAFLPYVFDYFRQADSATTRKFGGLGLGLAIVRHLVELHGGTVQADSLGEGQGSTFIVELPLMSISATEHQQQQFSQPTLSLQGVRVLVVDDDTDTREFLVFLLEQAGASVISASSAGEALRELTQFKPDILLSDIGMPDMDGYMLMRQVRALPSEEGGQIPAIALSAYAGEMNQQQAIAAGFQRHLAKPVEPEELIRIITSFTAIYTPSMKGIGSG